MRNNHRVEWLSILNDTPKIIFFTQRTFYCIFLSAIISLVCLKILDSLSQRNFLTLWFLMSIFSLTLTHSGIDDFFLRLLPSSAKWIDINSTWKPLHPNNNNKIYQGLDGFKGIAFQNFSDLDTIVSIRKGKQQFAVLLCRDRKGKFYAKIPFTLTGLHPDRPDEVTMANLDIISRAFNNYPKDENLELVMGARSRYCGAKLEDLAKNAQPPLIKAIDLNQLNRNFALTRQRKRQTWHHLAWSTWQETSPGQYLANSDFWGWAAMKVEIAIDSVRNLLTPKKLTNKAKYLELAFFIYRDGYLKWQSFFKSANLQVRAADKELVWENLCSQFGWNSAVSLPHWVDVDLDAGSVNINVRIECDLISKLLSGIGPSSNLPSSDRDFLKIGGQYCAIVYLKKPKDSWSAPSQLKWYWNLISKFGDIEVKVALSRVDKSEKLSDLVDLSRQATSFEKISERFGDDYNTFDCLGLQSQIARERLLGDNQIFEVKVGFFIYRRSLSELNEVVIDLCKSTFGVTLKREEILTAQRWVESLPINDREFLSKVSEKYAYPLFDSQSLPGYLPIGNVPEIDSTGIEFLVDSKPIHLNPLSSGIAGEGSRIVIAGTSGSGKTTLATRIVTFALSQNPIVLTVILELSELGVGSYPLYVKLLGRHGAFINLIDTHFNPLEPPYWQDLTLAKSRLAVWQNDLKKFLLSIFTRKLSDDLLITRIDDLTSLILRAFLEDYKPLFEQFWQDGAKVRTNLPTIVALKKYLSPSAINIDRPTDLDWTALSQIERSIVAVLSDPFLGRLLSRPSNIPLTASLYVVAFNSAALGSQVASIMNALAQMLVNKITLAAPQSLLIIEEFSRLLKSDGFDDLAGENFNISRKEGRTIAIIVHDLEDLQNCRSSTNILSNFTHCFLGKNNAYTLAKYEQSWRIPPEIINQLSSDAANFDRHKLTSKFLLLTQQNYQYLEVPSPPLELGVIATNTGEKKRRTAVLSLPEYQGNLKNILSGIKKFSYEEYCR